jgi:hypothetical protein
VTSLIGLEAQVAVIGATALLILAGGFLWSRRLFAEKNHEE